MQITKTIKKNPPKLMFASNYRSPNFNGLYARCRLASGFISMFTALVRSNAIYQLPIRLTLWVNFTHIAIRRKCCSSNTN